MTPEILPTSARFAWLRPHRARCLAGLVAFTATACIAYSPRELAPDQSAEAFRARTLRSPDLAEFLEAHDASAAAATWDLERLTLAGLYFSPQVRAARAELEVRRAAVRVARQRPNPELALNAEHLTNTGGASPTAFGLALDWPIEVANKRGLRVHAAELDYSRALIDARRTLWSTRQRIVEARIELEFAERSVRALDALAQAQEQRARALRTRVEAGALARPVLTDAELEASRARAKALDARSMASVARASLAQALGAPAQALDEVELAAFATDEAVDGSREGPEVELLRRGDLAAALIDYEASDNELRAQVAKQWPDVRLGPGYTYDQGQNRFALGAAFQIPLLHGARAAIEEASARREASAASFAGVQARAIGEIETARVAFAAARGQWAAQRAIVDEQRARSRAIEERVRVGAGDSLDRLDAQIALQSAQFDALAAERRWADARAALEAALEHPLGDPSWNPLPEWTGEVRP